MLRNFATLFRVPSRIDPHRMRANDKMRALHRPMREGEITMRFSMIAAACALGLAATPALAQDFDPMQFADGDKDGKVTLEEYTAFQTQAWGFISQGSDKIKVADMEPMMQPMVAGIAPDAEGFVTQAAFVAYIPTRFKSADGNSDGSLTSAELRASLGMPAA
jgi:hypothetical protein